MSKFAICDLCGEKDDWSMGKGPFLPHGVVLQFRSDNDSEDAEAELEICESCKNELLEKNPKLAASLKQKTDP